MPRTWGWVAGLVLATALLAAQNDSLDTATTSRLIALENAWNQAQLHHDDKALDRLVSEKFVYTDTDGSVLNKARFLADTKDPDYRPTLMANEGVHVNLYQNVAIVYGTYHSKGTYKNVPFEHYGRFTDTWILRNSNWQCVASHTTLAKK